MIHHGNCVIIMADMPEHSVDAIVCDPPYDLTAGKNGTSGGFMGKQWDATGVAFDPDTWRAALRVLKPGGHLLAFGGTRTAHRLAVAVEDAGFEIRDSIAWLYGCLDRDSQVLTNQGWRYGLDLTGSEDVAQWNTDGSIEFVRPSHVHRYPFDGQMVRFLSADTDQLLTPNHRVYSQQYERTMTDGVRVGRWGDWRVDEAGTINRWQRRRFPVAGKHDGPGIGGVDYAALLGWVWTDGGFDHSPSTGVRVYQSSVNRAKCDEIAGILDRLAPHKRYDYKRTWAYKATVRDYVASTWFFTGDLAQRVRSDLPDKRQTYDLLLRMTQEEKVAFCDAAMKGDGSHGQFYQKNRDDLEWFQALCTLTGQRSVLGMRKAPRDGGAVYTHQQATTELQRRHLRESTVDYVGDVWCVTVPSGAFVARRNGKVFVTGNSGFPKSLDVSKAIDKVAGAEREVIGPRVRVDGKAPGKAAGIWSDTGTLPTTITAPATAEAAKWQGWGTALKPAHEPIIVARKPLQGTVAANVQAHGTGALNIDGCRIGDDTSRGDRYNGKPPGGSHSMQIAGARDKNWSVPPGRWPANVVLDEDQAAALDAQSGTLKSGAWSGHRNGSKLGHLYGDFAGTQAGETPREANQGGASRFYFCAKAPKNERPIVDGVAHPTVKPLTLMRWLVRLVTPPGGTVLDPFAGSGATIEAAILEGFTAVGIEQDAAYLPLIQERIRRSQARPDDPGEPTLFEEPA